MPRNGIHRICPCPRWPASFQVVERPPGWFTSPTWPPQSVFSGLEGVKCFLASLNMVDLSVLLVLLGQFIAQAKSEEW